MDQNTVIKKDLYFMSGFDAKRIFQREMVKSWQNAVFNLKWRKTHFSRKVVFHEWIWCKKTSFIGQSLNFGKMLFSTKTEENTLFKNETYYISRFEETRIVKRELVKIWQNALLNPKLSKTHFSRKACTPWVHSMQNAFFSDKWWNSGRNAVVNTQLSETQF